MKTPTLLFLTVFFISTLSAQDREQQHVQDEGRMLYKSEMASWNGTDIFLERFPDQKPNIGGYFSYEFSPSVEKCIFFSNTEQVEILADIAFDSTFNPNTAVVDRSRKEFTAIEKDLYSVRRVALKELQTDTMFVLYKNTNFNIIPFRDEKGLKVIVLTGPQNSGVVIFGNDYEIKFNSKYELTSKKKIHQSLIAIEYGKDGKQNGMDVEGTMHTHLPSTGDLITSTDICTLLLYEKYAGWKTHYVVGKVDVSMWDCKTNTLGVVSRKVLDKINKDQKRRHPDK
jgi:hypothetical protein